MYANVFDLFANINVDISDKYHFFFSECQRLLSRILDDMGEASARAQGLNKPITSALKLRDTDHMVYLLVDNEGNK